MNDVAAIPMSENDIIVVYNIFCKIWEFEVDGRMDAYIRTLMIKDLPEADSILIGNMNKNNAIKNLGESDYTGFKISSDSFETHLYLADVKTKNKLAVSVMRPIFASSNWVNVVVADRKLFAMDVDPKQLGAVLNFYGSLFAACFNCNTKVASRGAKYFYREILANIFVASVNGMSAKDIRKHSDPEGYFSDEFNKKVIEYNSEILSTMQKGKPFIPWASASVIDKSGHPTQGKINDLLIILSLLEYQQVNTNKPDESEDYGEESDESSDSV